MDRIRRRVLEAGLALPAALWLPRGWTAEPTPACGEETPSQMAGPFYTPDSPSRADFRADDPGGKPVSLRATVLDRRCGPLPGAIVDLWHADSGGRYDNDGFRLRGHQRADPRGSVRFETVRPANYGGRTAHYHVRIHDARGTRLLTTQLYFPDDPANAGDGLFRRELLLEVAAEGAVTRAGFRFVV